MKLWRAESSDGTEVNMCFHCPACKISHPFRIKGPKEPIWKWNESMDKPTFQPSLIVYHPKRCHSFVTDGKIQYLNDCAHDLAGKTVDLPEIEDE